MSDKILCLTCGERFDTEPSECPICRQAVFETVAAPGGIPYGAPAGAELAPDPDAAAPSSPTAGDNPDADDLETDPDEPDDDDDDDDDEPPPRPRATRAPPAEKINPAPPRRRARRVPKRR